MAGLALWAFSPRIRSVGIHGFAAAWIEAEKMRITGSRALMTSTDEGGIQEHLGDIHPQADRPLDVDGGDPAARPDQLRAAAGGRLAEHRLADDPGHRAISGRRCADRRQYRHDAARTEFWRDTRPDADDFEQRYRIFRDYNAIRSQHDDRVGSGVRAGGDQCDLRLPAADNANSPNLS